MTRAELSSSPTHAGDATRSCCGMFAIEWRVGGGGREASWRLRWTIEPLGGGRVSARGEREHQGVFERVGPADEIEGVWTVDERAGLIHVDIPGALRATIESAEHGAPRVLYAHSPMLAAMGARGGEVGAPAALPVNRPAC